MATKKQQRRKYLRAKEHARRPMPEDGEPKPERAAAAPKRTTGKGKTPQPPSWSRAAKRAALFSVGLLVVIQIMGAAVTPAQAVVEAALFFVWLVVLGFYMDRFLYSRWLKQQG